MDLEKRVALCLQVLNDLYKKIDNDNGEDTFSIDDLLTFSKYNIFSSIGMEEEVYSSYMKLLDSILEGMLLRYMLDKDFFGDTVTNEAKVRIILTRIDSYLPHVKVHVEWSPEERQKKMEFAIFRLGFFLRRLRHYTPSFNIKESLNSQEMLAAEFDILEEIETRSMNKKDGRLSQKAPTIKERIKALKTFCPDLFNVLSGKGTEVQEKVIHLITGANLVDSYKYSFGGRSKELDNVEIENLNEILEQIKKA